MNKKEFREYIVEVANQCAITYTKTAWRDAEDFEKLKAVLMSEMELAFEHLIVEVQK